MPKKKTVTQKQVPAENTEVRWKFKKVKKQAPAENAEPRLQKMPSPSLIALDAIDRSPWQVREDFPAEEMIALAETIRECGLLQPIIVRQVGERYELIEGERRVRASRLIAANGGPRVIRAEVVQATDAEVRRIVFVSANERKQLSPIEEARAFRAMLDGGDAASITELADMLGISRPSASNKLRLLDLPKIWRDRLQSGQCTERQARGILPLRDLPQVIDAIEQEIAREEEFPSAQYIDQYIIKRALLRLGVQIATTDTGGTVRMEQGEYDRGSATFHPYFMPQTDEEKKYFGLIEHRGDYFILNKQDYIAAVKCRQIDDPQPETEDDNEDVSVRREQPIDDIIDEDFLQSQEDGDVSSDPGIPETSRGDAETPGVTQVTESEMPPFSQNMDAVYVAEQFRKILAGKIDNDTDTADLLRILLIDRVVEYDEAVNTMGLLMHTDMGIECGKFLGDEFVGDCEAVGRELAITEDFWVDRIAVRLIRTLLLNDDVVCPDPQILASLLGYGDAVTAWRETVQRFDRKTLTHWIQRNSDGQLAAIARAWKIKLPENAGTSDKVDAIVDRMLDPEKKPVPLPNGLKKLWN